MFHRGLLPKNGLEFRQQFNCAISYGEAHCTNILVNRLITIAFFVCCCLCYLCASKKQPSVNTCVQ